MKWRELRREYFSFIVLMVRTHENCAQQIPPSGSRDEEVRLPIPK
jgi:hypothetical protein